MVSTLVEVPWWEAQPDLLQEVQSDLREHYATLRLDLTGECAEVCGTYPVRDNDGTVLDRWAVSILLPPAYPSALPVVRETGGRLIAGPDNHVLNVDGTACVLLPETRFRSFPRGAPFRVYLDGPLRSFFAVQSYRVRGGTWVHGEWEHGAGAAITFYQELLGATERVVGWRALIGIALGLMPEQPCPCGRRRPVARCHPDLVAVRDNLGEEAALLRLDHALQEEFHLRDTYAAAAFLEAISRRPMGHHACPCGSGRRVRACHAELRALRDAWPFPRRSRSKHYR